MLSIFLGHRWNVSSVKRNKRCRIFCPVKQSMLGIFLSQIKPSWLTGRYKPITHHIFFSLQSKPFPSEGENVCDSAVAQGVAGKDWLEWGARMKSAIMEKGVREKSQKTGVIVSSTLAAVVLDKTPLFCVTLEVSHTLRRISVCRVLLFWLCHPELKTRPGLRRGQPISCSSYRLYNLHLYWPHLFVIMTNIFENN